MTSSAGAVDRVIRGIDAVSTAAGWLAGWFIVPMTLAVTYEVIARYAWEIGERTGLRILGVSVPMSALKGIIPFTAALLLLQMVGLLLVMAFPAIGLWFPHWLYGK